MSGLIEKRRTPSGAPGSRVGVSATATVSVGVGVAGQPLSALLTAWIRQLIGGRTGPSHSSARQSLTCELPKAMFTPRMSSSILTIPLKLQSPTQSGSTPPVAVGVAGVVPEVAVDVGGVVPDVEVGVASDVPDVEVGVAGATSDVDVGVGVSAPPGHWPSVPTVPALLRGIGAVATKSVASLPFCELPWRISAMPSGG